MRALLLLALFAASQPVGEPPAVIQSRSAMLPPVWVRADAAIGDRGELTSALGQFRDDLEQYTSDQRREQNRRPTAAVMTAEDAPCQGTFVYPAVAERHMPRDTALDLVSHARAVFYGRAIGSVQGFYYGTPGTLFTIRVDQSLTPSASREIYTFFPYARITRNGRTFCSNPIGTPARPAVGDQFLVFAMTDADDRDGCVYQPDADRELAFQIAGGALVLPPALQSDTELSKLASLKEIARTLLEHDGVGAGRRAMRQEFVLGR